jgi:hypothetical protein
MYSIKQFDHFYSYNKTNEIKVNAEIYNCSESHRMSREKECMNLGGDLRLS